ncbi:efflux transporter outer membrane subunit [Caulobacter sp. S45]|uniref:efflux transporter outer membrane subunit n=1 Tax=Caulobacter sp. S45 TaxID=1641861 RepID=UPI00131DDC43|nr:efflux transporter outer membrane subunit [Caulobacter sp. S45]
MIRLAIRPLGGTLTAALLAGCAVGPNFHRPAPPPAQAGYAQGPLPARTEAGPAGLAGADAQTLAYGQDLPGQWWTLFHSPALDALVADAIRANPDLDSARAALKAAQAEVQFQRGGLLPTAAISGQASREKDSNTLSPTLNQPLSMFSLYTVQLAISYTPDVFGGVRRSVENARALAEQQRYELEASYLTITTNVANAAIQAAGLQAQIDAYERLVAIDRDLLTLYGQEKALGQLAQVDVAAQVAALAQAEAQLAPLRRQLVQQQDLMAELTGRTPAEFTAPPIRLADLTLPDTLPVSLPSKLLDQRPDIRAAEANLHAASAAVGVAVAARLPSITLNATGGGASTGIGSLLTNGNNFWTLAGGFAQPVFQGGQLLAKQREAEAQYAQARAQYRSTVLAAFQNVADALHAVEIDAQALRATAAAEQASLQAFQLAQAQQRLGQTSGAQVLVVEQAYRNGLQAEAQAQAARYADTVALFQALGGGWWGRQDR